MIDRAFKPIWQHLLREIGSCPRQRMGHKTTFETKPIYRNAHFYSIHVFDDFEDLGLAKNPSLWLPLAPTSEKKKHDRSFDCDVKPGCQATVKIHQNLHGRTFGPFCRPVGHGFFLGFGVISGFSSSTYLYPGFQKKIKKTSACTNHNNKSEETLQSYAGCAGGYAPPMGSHRLCLHRNLWPG